MQQKSWNRNVNMAKYEASGLMPEVWGNWTIEILFFFKGHCNSHFIHKTFLDYCPPHLFLSLIFIRPLYTIIGWPETIWYGF